jgi:hypothetical protein
MRTGFWKRDLDKTHREENKKKMAKERKSWSKEDHLSFSRSTVKKRILIGPKRNTVNHMRYDRVRKTRWTLKRLLKKYKKRK